MASNTFRRLSGKKRAHKHISFWLVTPSIRGQSPGPVARGQRCMCYPREPKGDKSFCPGTRPRRSVTGVPDRVSCAKVLCAFSYDPGGPLKKCRSPDLEKCRKKCFGKCQPETGCRGKCRKKCSGSRASVKLYRGAGPGALFSALSSAPRFGPALSEALFSALFQIGASALL